MKNSTNSLLLKRGNILVFVILVLLQIACSKEEEGIPHRDISGTYKLESAYISFFRVFPDGGGESTGETLTNDCILKTTLELKSNGEVRQILYSEENCEKPIIRVGSWKVTSTFFSNFIGEIVFEDSQLVYEVFESMNRDEVVIQFNIEYEDENPPENIRNYRYHYTYKRVE